MKVNKPEPTLHIELDKHEIEVLRDITQNPPIDLIEKDKQVLLNIWVACSRALGYNVNSDGTANRSGGFLND